MLPERRFAIGLTLVVFLVLAYLNNSKVILAKANVPARSFAVPVLMYHHFAPPGLNIAYNNVILAPARFERQMKYLKENRYNVIFLRELCEAMEKGKPLPPKTVVITMDDGYESNYVYAFPILKKYNIKATINLIVSFVKEENPTGFNPEKTTFLSWKQVKEMQASGLVDFQSHTFNHHHYLYVDANKKYTAPMLVSKVFSEEDHRLETDKEYEERVFCDLKKAKAILEEKLGKEVFALAYPYGAYNHKVQELAKKAGYKMHLTIKNGLNRYGDSLLEIRRVNVAPGDDMEAFSYKLQHGREK
ncbi:MAG: polysaccharide deacetylase family protein [Bacillota bacterium]|uniref:Polysaccharide deacetylase family protein n=1 Tax=Thermanaerosceptrum fracticalcis TaxID=1712410 RepID=A0A7G6E4I4_THEFR|nr:polysaccharide deacetylase family protein [Thermanaerosceptrum fracticalcis]QNB46988.1 polysaccharide deacetylase family protein [Thermanaerosceptrum fracticalcis]